MIGPLRVRLFALIDRVFAQCAIVDPVDTDGSTTATANIMSAAPVAKVKVDPTTLAEDIAAPTDRPLWKHSAQLANNRDYRVVIVLADLKTSPASGSL